MSIKKELLNLCEELKREYPAFPNRCCMEAAERAEESIGLKVKFGLFIDDDGNAHNHYWNRKNGEIYDITAIQYSKKIPQVHVIPVSSPEAEERYIENVFAMF